MIPLGLDQIQLDSAIPLMPGMRTARLAELDATDLAAWGRLSEHSGSDSVFACDWFVRPVLAQFDPAGQHSLFIAVDRLGEWYGVAVLDSADYLGRIPLAHWAGLSNANQFLGVPLVRKGREAEFWRILLSALDWQGRGQAAMCLNDMPADHRVTKALLELAEAEGRMAEILARRERAALFPEGGVMPQLDSALSAKRQSRLRGLERKLERDYGPARVDRPADNEALEAWLADFLRLEASGWKGRAGSALASAPDSKALFCDAVRGAHASGAIVCLSLSIGDQIVAMSSFFLKDGHGFGFKCCFDERFASYAPGILLLRRIMDMVEPKSAICFDSCSAPHEVTINGLWPQRREMLDLAVSLQAPLAELRFDGAMRARRAWHWWKARGVISPEAA
jgi:CelD/BcsL family acetyltransferase involved in cellulose biosynthesis